MRHEIYSWLPPDPPMSGTIQLYHSELPVHTFALGICRVTIRLLHSSALVLMEHPICSTGGVFEERVEYITSHVELQYQEGSEIVVETVLESEAVERTMSKLVALSSSS